MVSIIPTDTLYGIVAPALDPEAVASVYQLKKRAPEKASIILISGLDELDKFGIRPQGKILQFLSRVWPGAVSAILHCPGEEFWYLHRGTNRLAFRVPASEKLRIRLRELGPLIAPSANPEGLPPASTVAEARAYFGDAVDEYEDGGTLTGHPSTLIDLANGKPNIIRQGRTDVSFESF